MDQQAPRIIAHSIGGDNTKFNKKAVHLFCKSVHIGRSRSSKVIDLGTNRKRVCNFLLVRHSNLGPNLPRFRDSAGFLLRN